jgi:hypothetical protein
MPVTRLAVFGGRAAGGVITLPTREEVLVAGVLAFGFMP